jgi:hypothetical protein
MYLSTRSQKGGDLRGSFGWTYTAYVAAVCVMALATFPTIDRWQDLKKLAGEIHTDTEHTDLALLTPDETTIAMLDNGLRTRFEILDTDAGGTPEQLVSDWFNTHGSAARILVLLPGHASGDLTRLIERFRPIKPPGDGIASALKSRGIAAVERRYELPQGRRYALIGPVQR